MQTLPLNIEPTIYLGPFVVEGLTFTRAFDVGEYLRTKEMNEICEDIVGGRDSLRELC